MILQGDELPLGDFASVVKEVLEQVIVVSYHTESKRSAGEESRCSQAGDASSEGRDSSSLCSVE